MATKVKAIEANSARRGRGEIEFRGFRGTPGYNQIFAYTEDKPRVSKRTSAIIAYSGPS